MKELSMDGPFEYKATVDLIPEVELPDYKALADKQTVRKPKATKKQVDEALEEIRTRNANLVPVEGRASEKEDLVILEFVEERPAGFNEDTVAIWAGMEDNFVSRQVMGHTTEDTFSLEIEYPGDFDNEELAGITVKNPVKVVEIKTKELPELNDDFAADLGIENLNELKKQVKEDLLKNDADMARYESLGKLFDETVKSTTVDLSDGFIERKVCEMKSVEKLEDIEEDIAEVLTETRAFFTRYFVIEEISKREGIAISNDEVESIKESQMQRGGYAQGKGEIYDYLLNTRLTDRFFPADIEEDKDKEK
jgi:trigger factor